MGSKLVKYYPQCIDSKDMPPIFTVRTLSGLIISFIMFFVTDFLKLKGESIALFFVMLVLFTNILVSWIRSLHYKTQGIVADILFLSPFILFFIPYVLSLLYMPIEYKLNLYGLATLIIFVIIMRLFDINTIKIMFNRDLIMLMSPINKITIFLRVYMIIMAAVFEELFYRGFLMNQFKSFGLYSVIITSVLFTLQHFSNRWASVNTKYNFYIKLFIFSIGIGLVKFYTNSIIACLVGHLLYNSITVVHLIYRYVVSSKNCEVIR